jgi:WG containing repeat
MKQLYPIFVRTGRSPRKFEAGFIDAHGAVVISPVFEDAGDFRDNQSPVQMGRHWGLIDMQGEFLFPCKWAFPTRFVNGYAVIRDKRGSKPERRGYLRLDGTWIVEPKYVLATAFSCGRAQVFDGNSYGFINENGDEVIPLVFKDARRFSEDVAPVKLDEKWSYIDVVGNSAIRPQFDAAMPFNEGLARVSVNGSWGFINHAGEFVIPPQFAMVWDMHSGLAVASTEKKSPKGFIDKTGKFAIEPAYEYVSNFQEGVACVTPVNQSLQSFIGPNGEQAFAREFWSADSFYMQRALVKTEKTIAYIDIKGQTVWETPIVDRTVLPF